MHHIYYILVDRGCLFSSDYLTLPVYWQIILVPDDEKHLVIGNIG